MKQRRIPAGYVAFNAYIGRTATFLWSDDPANPGHKQYERLGLTLAEATEWKTRNTDWAAIWALYENPLGRSWTIARTAKAAKKSFALYGHPVVNRIATNPAATQTDADIFNFVLYRKKPTRRTVPISEIVLVGINRTGSTEFGVQCRYTKDSKRPSLLPGADGVEYSYKVVTVQPADLATVDPEGDGFRQRTIRKARFTYPAGTENKGKFLLIAFRWSFSPNTAFNGPWTEVMIVAIF